MSDEEFAAHLYERVQNLLEIGALLDEELEDFRRLTPSIVERVGYPPLILDGDTSLAEKFSVMLGLISLVRSHFCRSLPFDTVVEIDRVNGNISETKH